MPTSQEPSFGELHALAGEHLGLAFEDDPVATVKLASIGLTLDAWRNTSLEDLHAGDHPGGGFTDSTMMRFNIATTKAAAKYVNAEGVNWNGLLAMLTDPDRPLPGGLTVGELAGDGFDRLIMDVDRVVRVTAEIEAAQGFAYTLTLLALHAGLFCKGWYGSPWWPDVVDVFIERLADPAPAAWRHDDRQVPEPGSVADREALREALREQPEALDDGGICWCLEHGLTRGAAFVGYARWRRRREPGWTDPSPWLSEEA